MAKGQGYFDTRGKAGKEVPVVPEAKVIGVVPITISSAEIIGVIPIDIKTQTVGVLGMSLSVADVIGNLPISLDIANVVGNIAVALAASAAMVDLNIKAQATTMNVKVADQAKGTLNITDWATRDAVDIHLQGVTAALAAGATATLITITLTETSEHWLYTVHISGTKTGLGKVRANKTVGFDELAGGYFPANDGYIKDWIAPVKRKKDVGAGITQITVEVTNTDAAAGDFMATLDGLRVVDITAGDKVYTSQADWQGCATKTDVDLTTSPGDVIPEEV